MKPKPGVDPRPEALVRDSLARIQRAVKQGSAGPSLAVLAAAAGVSVRSLQRHFIDVLGKSPRTVIADARLQRALFLVQTTSMTLADVAVAAGFASQSRMNELFRRRLGQPPGTYRVPGPPRERRPGKTGVEKPNVSFSYVSRGRKTGGNRSRH